MGRPARADIASTRHVGFRLTQEEEERLDELVLEQGHRDRSALLRAWLEQAGPSTRRSSTSNVVKTPSPRTNSKRPPRTTAKSTRSSSVAPGKTIFEPVAFRKALRTTVLEIDRRDRHDGLVPIAKVRRALAHLGLDRPTFDAALLEEERAYTVDLKIANDPTRVKEPEGGISSEGRGLLYFVVVR